jgi:hypothetical protein
MHPQQRGKFPACGNAIARAKVACMDERAELIAKLDVEWDVTLGLEMYR